MTTSSRFRRLVLRTLSEGRHKLELSEAVEDTPVGREIDKVFEDTSVPTSETKARLLEIADYCQRLAASL